MKRIIMELPACGFLYFPVAYNDIHDVAFSMFLWLKVVLLFFLQLIYYVEN